jgi:hypothetical protein
MSFSRWYDENESRVVTIHPPRDLTGLLVAPSDRPIVCLVVHESAIETRFLVWAGRLDVNLNENQ